MSNAGTPLSAPELWQKKAPEKVAASVKGFEDWLEDSIVQRVKNSTVEKIQQEVEAMSELVVPQAWLDTTCHPPFDKLGAAAFRKAVVSGASPTSFKASDDADSRAILGTLHTLVALYWDIKSRNASVGNNDKYAIDGKPEFGEGFCVALEESIWLTENAITTRLDASRFTKPIAAPVSSSPQKTGVERLVRDYITTSEAHPDALVAYGPINGTTIAEELRFILQGTIAPDRTTVPTPL
ncbi:hypothetical protein BDZ89DRAFT_1171390 [Hymenopellis radicata]|nr:hypothetical protein BDZ89DRAFT_1171390 [Hymenopellis radicata]